MINPKLPAIYYGGDYNPDQWPEELWQEDMRLLKLANVNIVTVPVFSWAKLQPAEDVYEFGWLDRILDLAAENGIYVCLATSTAAQPAWMSVKYPEMLLVDFEGKRRKHGARVNFCPNSSKYREFSQKLAGKLAERYKDHPALVVWHIANEYSNNCYCDHCEEEFRNWLKNRYGTIGNLNEKWDMGFWGHTVYSWEEVFAPSGLNEMWKVYPGDYPSFETWKDSTRECSSFQTMSMDYKRFMNESTLQCYIGEYNVIKAITPDVPITTNLMGTFKPLDYSKWAEYMDIISWDSYPALFEPAYKAALRNDLMRSLKGNQPYMIMEQTPSQNIWWSYNSLRRPGEMRLLSYQTLAHGADTIMFFQMRRSIGNCEKYHSAIIDHAGHENTRVFRECRRLGEELKGLGDTILDSRINAKAAIIFDWENWWAVEMSNGPSIQLNYLPQIEKYYKALHDLNISVDLVKSEADISKYALVIAPLLYMIKPGVADKLKRFVENGGTFVTTFFSGYVNENDIVTVGGYPGEFRKLLGIWVEEIDALYPDMANSIVMNEAFGKLNGEYGCGMFCDILHLEGAKALAVYGKDFYAGSPVLTVNRFGKGKAYYVATDPEESFIKEFVENLCSEAGIKSQFEPVSGIEITQRFKDGQEFTFVLNHNFSKAGIDLKACKYIDLLTSKMLSGRIELNAKDVLILKEA